ncbi:hypothetical protein ES705_41564 [subsurface metagenome]
MDNMQTPEGVEDDRQQRKIPGIIFIAKALYYEEIEKSFSKQKHDEIRWIDKNDLETMKEEDFVPDAFDTINRAINMWSHWNQETAR